MKISQSLPLVGTLLAISLMRMSAQVVETIVVIKGSQWVQTAAATQNIDPRAPGPGYGGPFNFRIGVEGTNLSVIQPPVVTLAPGSQYPTENPTRHNGGELAFSFSDQSWRYGIDAGNYGAQSESARDTSFAAGIYGFTVMGTSFDLNFATAAFPENTPLVTLSGGTWSAGKYVINVGQALTITTNTFTNFDKNTDGAMDFFVEGVTDQTIFYSDNPSGSKFVTYTIPANTLSVGTDYSAGVSFYAIVDKDSAISSSFTAAAYQRANRFTISAVGTPAPGARATFYGVGDLYGGDTYSEVRDATKSGGVIYAVGGSSAYIGSTGPDTGFLWTSTSGMTALPNQVSTYESTTALLASAITPNGAYIGSRARAGTGGNERHAVRVTTSGLTNLDLGAVALPLGSTLNSAANSISSDGSVMYGFARNSSGNSQAARFTASGPTTTAIPFLNGGDTVSSAAARGTSSDGAVVIGTSSTSGSFFGTGNQAFRYTYPAGTVSAIPFLSGGTWSVGSALSPNGNLSLVVGSSTASPGGEPYIFNAQATSTTSLGTPGGFSSPATLGGLSSDGSVVAISFDYPSSQGFIHNSTGWHSLPSIMASAGVTLSGWTLDTITGMSSDGTLLFGRGTHNGSSEGWIVEFASGYLVSFGCPQADFNSDGKSDIIWQNTATGDCYIWLMDGAAYSSHSFLTTIPLEWRIVGRGDFNGDGKPDIVWQNTSTGDCYVWFMNGTALSSYAYLTTISTDWRISGTGDFNGDGQTDIIWKNSVNGACYIWLMNGATLSSAVYVTSLPSEWRIAGVGDFNNDGKADIVWQNTTTGDCYIWLMNGAVMSSYSYLTTISTDWRISGTGDFNSDGKTDIIWQNTGSGACYIWYMNGTSYSSNAYVTTNGTQWLIAN